MRALAAAAFAALVVLAGCGGDEGTTPEDAAREVVTKFGQASAKKDYQTICDDLIARSLADNVEEFGLPCELAFKRGLEAVRRPRLVIRSVTVRGDTARVRIHTTAANQPASDDTLQLRRVDGEWRISALSAAPAPQRSAP
ncbi:MAG TPA: nuclear transport factor 2 family protein [Solirubrobacteraceae bacterium]